MTLRVVLVGLGEIHPTHAAALRMVPGIRVVAAHDPRQSATCELPGVERIPDLADLASRDDIDAAIIAVPTNAHAPVAAEMMAAGFDVLIEKPIVTSLEALRDLYAIADAGGRVCQAALHDSVGDEVVYLTGGLLDELRPTFGRLLRVRAEYNDPYAVSGEEAARRPSMSGSWLDSGSNALSVVALFVHELYALGATLSLDAVEAPAREDLAAEVRFAGTEAGGTEASDGGGDPAVEVEIATSWLRDRRSKETTLTYERGAIGMDHVERRITIVDGAGAVRTIDRLSDTPRMVTQYVRVFEDFALACDRRADNRAFAKAVHEPLLHVYDPTLPVARVVATGGPKS